MGLALAFKGFERDNDHPRPSSWEHNLPPSPSSCEHTPPPLLPETEYQLQKEDGIFQTRREKYGRFGLSLIYGFIVVSKRSHKVCIVLFTLYVSRLFNIRQLEKTSIEVIIIGDTVIKPLESVRNLGS